MSHPPLRILFCDDSGGAVRGFTQHVAGALGDAVEAVTASSVEGFRAQVEDGASFDVVISDLNFELVGGGPKDGLLILRESSRHWPDAELLLVTAFAGSLGVEEGLDLASAGLSREHLFHKVEGEDPSAIWARLRERLQGILQGRRSDAERRGDLEREGFFHRSRALDETLRRLAQAPAQETAAEIRGSEQTCFAGMVAQGFTMHELIARIQRAARRQSDVLILGETGTGKELVARALHAGSPRADQPFVKTDLASLSKELIPAELFGHEKGAFTGADQARTGLVAEADGGVLFFDEIGNLSADVQAGLLRVLEDRCFRPLGASQDRKVDVVVIAATHVDLEEEIREGRFRADLMERLDIVRLELPPLRERREDIPLLAVCFLADLRERFRVPGFTSLTRAALEVLARHPWPRNVRQLRNALERLFTEWEEDTDPLDVEHLRPVLPAGEVTDASPVKSLARRVLDGDENLSLVQLTKRYGEDAVREVIRDTFLEFRGPPDDERSARLFGGTKASTWRQFAFKRGLTYKSILAEGS